MWRATIKGLLAKKLRLALVGLSVVLGVGFVAGTYVLTDTMNAAFDQLFKQTSSVSDVTVRGVSAFAAEAAGPGGGSGSDDRPPVPGSLLPTIESVPGVASAVGDVSGYAQIVDPVTDEAIGGFGPPTIGANWNALSDGMLTIRDGDPPAAPDQVVVDAGTASTHDLHVGQQVEILLQGPPQTFTISGIAGFGTADNLAGATLAVFDTATAQKVLDRQGVYDSISIVADDGVGPTQLRDDIQQVLPEHVEAVTSASVGEEQSQQLQDGLGFFRTALLVFAGVALFVGSFIIFNTFSIIVAQRTRELALLRALGASRRQVMVSVVVEAAIVGLVASALGILAGVAIAVGLRALLGAFGVDLPSTAIQLKPRTIEVSLAVGTVVTLVAAIMPARRAAKVSPVEALREADPAAGQERGLGRRLALGGAVTGAGVGALMFGLFANPSKAYIYVGLGTALTFVGIAMLSPLIASPAAGMIGSPLAALGVSARLGRRNAMRNPRRTARTSSALMIGLGLVAMVAILSASLKASFDAALQESLKADYTVATSNFIPFSPDVAKRVAEVPGVAAASRFRQAGFQVDGKTAFVTAVDPATLEAVATIDMTAGDVAALGPDDVLVRADLAAEKGWQVGDQVPAGFASVGDHPLAIVGTFDKGELLGDYAIARSTYDALYTQKLDDYILVKVAEGADPATVLTDVEAAVAPFPNIDVLDQASFRAKQEGSIDQLLGLVTALLAMAIVIALFGIVNTLSLSIHERTRELGLLRAVGMSRSQTRAMVRVESVIIAVFGAALGIVVGIFFGWSLQHALVGEGVTKLAIPAGSLIVYVVFAGLAGVLAAIPPARRAAKLDVLQAISYE